MLPLHKILCPTDFSDFSYEALEKGAELARHFGAEMCVLHVTEPLPLYDLTAFPGLVSYTVPEYEKGLDEAASRALDELLARHHFEGLSLQRLIRRGHPSETIAAAAREVAADLLVIATHGATGWRQHVFGSVTDKVLRLAHCPVLVVRPEQSQQHK
jgi:nucleotide-binding universal stress UspA family protein